MPQEVMDKILDNLVRHRFIACWTTTKRQDLDSRRKEDTTRHLICTSIYISSSTLKKIHSSASTFKYIHLGQPLRPLKAPNFDILSMIQNIEITVGKSAIAHQDHWNHDDMIKPMEAFVDLIKWLSGAKIPRGTCHVRIGYFRGSGRIRGFTLCPIVHALGELTGFRHVIVDMKNTIDDEPDAASLLSSLSNPKERARDVRTMLSPTLGRCKMYQLSKADKLGRHNIRLIFQPYENPAWTFEGESTRLWGLCKALRMHTNHPRRLGGAPYHYPSTRHRDVRARRRMSVVEYWVGVDGQVHRGWLR